MFLARKGGVSHIIDVRRKEEFEKKGFKCEIYLQEVQNDKPKKQEKPKGEQ